MWGLLYFEVGKQEAKDQCHEYQVVDMDSILVVGRLQKSVSHSHFQQEHTQQLEGRKDSGNTPLGGIPAAKIADCEGWRAQLVGTMDR